MNKAEAPKGTQAVIRGIKLLKSFTMEKPELSLQELGDSIGLTRTTTHRLLTALESEGLIARTSTQSHYRLGPAVIALGSQALLTNDLRAVVRPYLEELQALTGETTTLEVMIGHQVLVLDGVQGRHLVAANLDIGTRWPAHLCSTGKAMLAHMDPTERKSYLTLPLHPNTPTSICDPEIFHRALDEIKARGYADTREELELDYVAVGAAFSGPLGRPEGAISIGGPARRFDAAKVEKLGKLLSEAATRISQQQKPH